MKLFGTSGIRGKFKEKITAKLSLNVGKALATYLKGEGKVIVGYDPRTSSQLIENALSAGLMEGGCDIIKIGMVPTPLVGYATSKLKAKAGVMITASHNPPEYNGIKIWNQNGMAYSPKQEQEIEKIIEKENYHTVDWNELGSAEYHPNITEMYIEDTLKHAKIKPGLKVVVDCGCGAASHITPILLRKAGCEVLSLNCQPDGFFPGRDPEPTPKNLKDLMSVVKASGADLGIAHDGDADRMVAVDEKGEFADFDKLLTLVAKEKGGKIITTVDASLSLDECLKKVGGTVIRTKVGDVHVAEALNKEDGSFGGEPSGTWLHPEFSLSPDGIFSALKLIEIVSMKGPLSNLLDEIPSYYNIRGKIPCPDAKKAKVMEKIKEKLPGIFTEKIQIDDIDGIRITFEDHGWILIRPSGTEPYIRVRIETKKKETGKKLYSTCHSFIKETIRGF
ncbi:MAG TPA: phosphoglucosamine mutase [Methanothermobacter sp.]|nr:probable phosphoglucosamine mutase [Methanothermobacter sp. MT-2]HHW04945.1 phosphoglucosamine mutase [Methanothermobacter sp.]HOK73278.1 phosphoglucosamine mutase [Methanothermobacter sp.]HOL69513.1 phosphoglucosamine mutase [Methanothermobacter sp.]HPQ05028.1 phosphoglucosamine mutase [Methanothermobacter sp.]